MNKDIKQMIVMLVSVAFIATLAIVVLSSSAAAIDGYYDDYDDGYDAEWVTGAGKNVHAFILILIIGFILYGVFNWIAEKTEHHYTPDTDTTPRRCLTREEQDELSVFTDSDEYKQTSNKDMALAYKIDRIVANRSQQADTGYYDENTGIYHSEHTVDDYVLTAEDIARNEEGFAILRRH